MSDITKCKGGACPLKDICYRYTAPEGKRQSYFAKPPYTTPNYSCIYFWDITERVGLSKYTNKLNEDICTQ